MISSIMPHVSINPTFPGLKPLLSRRAAFTGAPPTAVGLNADATSAVTTIFNASWYLIFSPKKPYHIFTLKAYPSQGMVISSIIKRMWKILNLFRYNKRARSVVVNTKIICIKTPKQINRIRRLMISFISSLDFDIRPFIILTV